MKASQTSRRPIKSRCELRPDLTNCIGSFPLDTVRASGKSIATSSPQLTSNGWSLRRDSTSIYVWVSLFIPSSAQIIQIYFYVGIFPVLYSQLLRLVRANHSVETSWSVYAVLAHSCISFCLSIRSMFIGSHATLTPGRHIQEIWPLAPWPAYSVPSVLGLLSSDQWLRTAILRRYSPLPLASSLRRNASAWGRARGYMSIPLSLSFFHQLRYKWIYRLFYTLGLTDRSLYAMKLLTAQTTSKKNGADPSALISIKQNPCIGKSTGIPGVPIQHATENPPRRNEKVLW